MNYNETFKVYKTISEFVDKGDRNIDIFPLRNKRYIKIFDDLSNKDINFQTFFISNLLLRPKFHIPQISNDHATNIYRAFPNWLQLNLNKHLDIIINYNCSKIDVTDRDDFLSKIITIPLEVCGLLYNELEDLLLSIDVLDVPEWNIKIKKIRKFYLLLKYSSNYNTLKEETKRRLIK